jgi:magnesium transporter
VAVTETRGAAALLIGDFARRFPGEVAREIETLPDAAAARCLRSLGRSQIAGVLERLTPDVAARVLVRLPDDIAGPVLAAIDAGRAVSLLSWLDSDARDRYLELLDPGTANEIRAIASYPEDSAGRLMSPRVTAVRETATAREALARLRSRGQHADGEIYTVDTAGRLTGVVTAQDVAAAALTETLGHLAKPRAGVLAVSTRDQIVEQLSGAAVASLPVVDVEGRLLGVIRTATLIDVAQEAASADIQTMVGASRDERALSKVSFAVRRRLPWLHVNLATAFLAASVVGLFEETIARFTALAVLMPVVAGQSGNTGAQALAVTMRGLALREIRPRHWLRIAFKEGRVAIINGVAIAMTTSAGVWLWSQSPGLAMVIGLAMVMSMAAAGLAGSIIPIGLTVSGQDPAQASSIILTTVTDVVGFLSFLGLATLFATML